MISVEILGDRVPGCDGRHPPGGCLRCYLLPRIEKALVEERERCAQIAENWYKLTLPSQWGVAKVLGADVSKKIRDA